MCIVLECGRVLGRLAEIGFWAEIDGEGYRPRMELEKCGMRVVGELGGEETELSFM